MPEIQNISWLYSSLLVITFFMWCNFSQLSPAQFPCTVLILSVWHPAGHPATILVTRSVTFGTGSAFWYLMWWSICLPSECLNIADCQSVSFWALTSAQVRSFGLKSRAVFCFDPLWNTGDTGVAATEQTCHGWPNQQQIKKNQLIGLLTFSSGSLQN